MNRTIYLNNPAYLKCKNQQLKIIDIGSNTEKGSIPIEDVGFLILDNPQITLTNYLINSLIKAKAVIVSCNEKHMPNSMHIPFAGHSEHTERVLQQCQMSEPLKKQLWKQTVESKIHNQARVIEKIKGEVAPMFEMMQKVNSGDTTNQEGVAAKYYWNQLFVNFTRNRVGDAPNDLLNFGYAILRSIIARALSSTGFHLAIGIHHKSKYNPSCLADDIMEPYRPYVDRLIIDYHKGFLDQDAKAHLLKIMQTDVRIDGKTRPLQIAATITAASLYKCILNKQKYIRYPIM